MLNDILTIMATLLGTLIAIFVSRKLYLLQTTDKEAKREVSGSLSLKVSTLKLANKGDRIIETKIIVENISSQPNVVLAAYVSYKPLVPHGSSIIGILGNFAQMDKFEDEINLSKTENVAYWSNSLFTIAPNEKEIFVRRDLVEKAFCEKYPIVIVNVDFYVASAKLVGRRHFPKFRLGKYRLDWCDYISDKGRNCFNVFSEATIVHELSMKSKIVKGELILLNKEGEIDKKETLKFKEMLRTTFYWSRQKTIQLVK